MKKRFLSMLLVLCMVFTLFPSTVFAEEAGAAIGTGGVTDSGAVCANHTEHDTVCGYIAAREEKPCSHLNEDGSYSCAPVKGSGVSGNIASPGDAEEPHVCDHTDSCGFAEVVVGAPCTHSCALCKQDVLHEQCSCNVLCTEDVISLACKICGKPDADLALCKGTSPAPLGVEPVGTAITDDGYSYENGTLTITTNAGTIAWRSNDTIDKKAVTKVVMTGVTATGANAFYQCEKLTTVTFPDSGFTTIGEMSFGNCKALTSENMTIPSTVKTIEAQGFWGCDGLTSVTIPEGVETIGYQAFRVCNNLKEVTIPSSVTTIDELAFSSNVKSLTKVTFSGTVSNIGKNAFDSPALKTVIFESATPPTNVGTNAFGDTAKSKVKIYVPAEAKAEYEKVAILSGYPITDVDPDAPKGIFLGRYSQWQVFDCQRDPGHYPAGGSTSLTVYKFVAPKKNRGASIGNIEGKTFYIKENTETDESEGRFSLCMTADVNDVSKEEVIHPNGKIVGLGDEGFLFISINVDDPYANGIGTFFSDNSAYVYGSGFTYTPDIAGPITLEEGKEYEANQNPQVLTVHEAIAELDLENLATNKVPVNCTKSTDEGGNGHSGDPCWSWDGSTLKLHNAMIFDGPYNSGISLPESSEVSKIELVGDNVVYGGINCGGPLTITGDGSLTVNGSIEGRGSLTITGGGSLTVNGQIISINPTASGPDSPDPYLPVILSCGKITAVGIAKSEDFDGLAPFTVEPKHDGMKYAEGSGTWDNTTGTAVIYVKSSGTYPITAVAVTPKTASVQKGNTQQFSAAVTGTNSPALTVTWTVTGGAKAGTTISTSGLLTVAADETATSLTVTATSTVDTSKSDTATVTVTTTPVTKYALTVTGGTGSGSYEAGTSVTITANAAPSGQRFREWTATGITLADKTQNPVTLTMPAGAVTLTAVYENIPTGGGSSSGGSSNTVVTPPAPDKPNTPTQAEIKVDTTTDANGSTSIKVTDKNINDAYDKALADARKNGNTANGVTIVLSATGDKTATNVTVNLPKTVQDTIISKKVVSTIIVVDNPDVQIGMDLKAVTEINAQAMSDVNITAQRMDSGTLTGSAQAAIGSRPVFNLAVSYGSGRQVQSFGAGGVSVSIPYTLGANETAGNVCAVYVDESGNVQWLTSSVYDSTAQVLRFSTNHFSIYGVGYRQDAPALTDISAHWAKADMEYVVSRGLLSGTSSTVFSPDTAMTRGMFVTALGRLANADVSSYKTSSFSDVKADSYYMGYIEWANKNGIVNGSDGKFMPDQSITREQMAVIMQNYAKAIGFTLPKAHEEKAFADSAKISGYARDAVKAMQMAGVLSVKSGNVFDPQGTATRAEVSAVLRRFVELRISIDTAQGWTMNDSGKRMYYENGKAVTGKKDIGGVVYTFDQNGETAD